MDGRHEERPFSVARFPQGGGGAQSAHNKRLYVAAHTVDRPRTGTFSRLRAARQTEAPRTSRTWEDHPDYGCCFVTTTSKLPNVPPETTQLAYFFLDGADKCRLVWKCQRPDIEECATYTFYGVRSAQPPAL